MRTLIDWLWTPISYILFISPASVRRGIGTALAFLWYDLFRIRRQVVLSNLKLAFPELSERQRVRLGRASLRNLGHNFVEYSFLPWLTKDNYPRYFEIFNAEVFEKARSQGKGVLLVTLHLGHGDLACAALSLHGWPIVMVSKFFKVKWLNDFWFGMRERLGTRFVAPRDSSYSLLRALKGGAAVVVPLDQFTGPPIGVRTKFFGHETGTAAGPAVMAIRSGAPVLCVYTNRDPKSGRHFLHFVRDMELNAESLKGPDGVARVTQAFNDELESYVRRHPEQWMWIHRRWKAFVE